ncbi:MAG: SMI1/KNR4 family protein [Terricaulis sp.]
MSEAIANYVGSLKRLGARAAEFLRQGSPSPGEKVRLAFPDLEPPPDLLALWRVFDGTEHVEGTTLEQMWLEGAFYFFSEEEAIDDYAAALPLWANDEGFAEYWPPKFFPIAKPGDGSRLLVNCIRDSPTKGAVYELFHGVGICKASSSVARYFETASGWLDAGAIWLDDARCLDRDFTVASAIAARLNPGCDNWDDSLPPAYKARDWIR